jgi:hypothetical protein
VGFPVAHERELPNGHFGFIRILGAGNPINPFVFEADVDNDIAYYSVYIDGQKVQSNRGITTISRLLWQKDRNIYFLSDGDISDEDDSVQPYASIAVWKRVLSEEEVATLGGVK